jgi:hypothetical protein
MSSIRHQLSVAKVSDLGQVIVTRDVSMTLAEAAKRFLSPETIRHHASKAVANALLGAASKASKGGKRAPKLAIEPDVLAYAKAYVVANAVVKAQAYLDLIPKGHTAVMPKDLWATLTGPEQATIVAYAKARSVNVLGYHAQQATPVAKSAPVAKPVAKPVAQQASAKPHWLAAKAASTHVAKSYTLGSPCPWCHVASKAGMVSTLSPSKLRQHFDACDHTVNVYVGK